MAKFLDKTMDEWDAITEQWHNDESIDEFQRGAKTGWNACINKIMKGNEENG